MVIYKYDALRSSWSSSSVIDNYCLFFAEPGCSEDGIWEKDSDSWSLFPDVCSRCGYSWSLRSYIWCGRLGEWSFGYSDRSSGSGSFLHSVKDDID